MQFLLIARDRRLGDSAQKRANARDEHMRLLHELKNDGYIHDAGALLSDEGEMIGSMIVANFPDRTALEAYLSREPFKRDGVWGEVEVMPFRSVNWMNKPSLNAVYDVDS